LTPRDKEAGIAKIRMVVSPIGMTETRTQGRNFPLLGLERSMITPNIGSLTASQIFATRKMVATAAAVTPLSVRKICRKFNTRM
jgi:hypothetical protein